MAPEPPWPNGAEHDTTIQPDSRATSWPLSLAARQCASSGPSDFSIKPDGPAETVIATDGHQVEQAQDPAHRCLVVTPEIGTY
jgi:hypothetical protein